MHTAFIVSTFPPNLGGMGEVVFEEAKRLSDLGHEITVFALKYPKTDYVRDQNQPFKIIRLKPLFKMGDAGLAPQLFFKLKNFDAVHLHYPAYGIAQCVFLAKIFRKQKYILTYHMEAQSGGVKKFLQKIYDFIWAKKILNNAEKIFIVNSSIIANSKYLKLIDKNKIEILFNAVDGEVFAPWPKEIKERKLKHEKIILFVGNLLSAKRLDLILEAIKNFSGIKLLVVGGGYNFEEYKKIARDFGVLDKVSFEGPCYDKRQLANYYNLADITVVSGDYESFSLVAIESLACECPVILSSGVLLAQEIKSIGAGEVFKTGDAVDLKNQLQKVLEAPNEVCDKMGRAGRKLVLEKYSWGSHIRKLVRVFEDLRPKT